MGDIGLVTATPGLLEYTADMCLCFGQIDSTHCSRESDGGESAHTGTDKTSLYNMIWCL